MNEPLNKFGHATKPDFLAQVVDGIIVSGSVAIPTRNRQQAWDLDELLTGESIFDLVNVHGYCCMGIQTADENYYRSRIVV